MNEPAPKHLVHELRKGLYGNFYNQESGREYPAVKEGVAQIYDEKTGQWVDRVNNKIKLYRIGSGGTYRVQSVPFGNQASALSVNYRLLLLEGFMTEPAFLRIQELIGYSLKPEEAPVDETALAGIAAREPGIKLNMGGGEEVKKPKGKGKGKGY